jgi:hypothetical protein
LVAPLPPIGPSPSVPVNISWNIELRKLASNFCEAAFALALMAAVGSCAVCLLARSLLGAKVVAAIITSSRYRPGWRRRL